MCEILCTTLHLDYWLTIVGLFAGAWGLLRLESGRWFVHDSNASWAYKPVPGVSWDGQGVVSHG